jgi:deazaflavin-dependent oxidoreductase (nitroreductase family)
VESPTKQAIDAGGIADITTTGRKTGQPHRIEIYFHQFDGDYYLTGKPVGPRDWEANIKANPEFTLHLEGDLVADVQVVGTFEPDPAERARIIRRARIESWNAESEEVEASIQQWVDTSPFVRFAPVEG